MTKELKPSKDWMLCFGLAAMLLACGGAGEGDKVACVICGDMPDLKGSVSSKTGSQAQMAGWVVAAFEHDSGIARVGEVDAAGLFSLNHVRASNSQTLALFTPDYILQAVLSIPGTTEKTIRQYVRFKSPVIPRLINNGPIVNFQNFDGLEIARDVAGDDDGDLMPNGTKKITGAGLVDERSSSGPSFSLLGAPAIDTDQDGVGNNRDPDVDGDGVINWLDPDDNGNGILDVFDPDQNGDLTNDSAPDGHSTDQYFSEGLEYVAVCFEMRPKDDGSGNETSLKFVAKVRDDVSPLGVQIRGAPSLLNGATYIAKDADGNANVQAWTRGLGDDGLSEDSNADDRLFAKKVILASGKAPRPHESIFFQLGFGSKDKPWFMEFPWSFPPLTPALVTSQYQSNTKQVLLIGNPFGAAVQDFIWTIQVYDAENLDVPVWTSGAVGGTTRQFAIQDNVLVAGKKYKYEVVAQTLDKIPGYPAYTIHSMKYEIK